MANRIDQYRTLPYSTVLRVAFPPNWPIAIWYGEELTQ
jgi:hypothetical protein